MRAAPLVVIVISLAGCSKPTPTTGKLEEKAPAPRADAPKEVPSVAFPPDDWTHKELADHLAKKGVKVTVRSLPLLSRENKTVAGFALDGSEYTEAIVMLCANATAARKQAGAMGKHAFSKGHFAFGYERGSRPPEQETPQSLEIHARNEAFIRKLSDALR